MASPLTRANTSRTTSGVGCRVLVSHPSTTHALRTKHMQSKGLFIIARRSNTRFQAAQGDSLAISLGYKITQSLQQLSCLRGHLGS